MNSQQAVRSLVRNLLFETNDTSSGAPMHLHLRTGFRRPGFREASAPSHQQQQHLDLKTGVVRTNGGGGINGGSDARSSRTLARQHASIADGHADAARNSRAADVIAAHRDAEDLHRQAAGHYHVAADAYRRGAGREAEGHIDRAQQHGRLAHTASRNVGGGQLQL